MFLYAIKCKMDGSTVALLKGLGTCHEGMFETKAKLRGGISVYFQEASQIFHVFACFDVQKRINFLCCRSVTFQNENTGWAHLEREGGGLEL